MNKIIMLYQFTVGLLIFMAKETAGERRVFKGTNIDIEKAPWTAALRSTDSHTVICGATIISRAYLLTAASCFDGPKRKYWVQMGTTNIGDPRSGQRSEVGSIKIHPEYKGVSTNYIHDVAAMKVFPCIMLSYKSKPIDLSLRPPTQEDTALLVGWGVDENNKPSDVLQSLDVVVGDSNKCWLERTGEVPADDRDGFWQFCTVGKGQTYGDIGGPLMINGKLAGIISAQRQINSWHTNVRNHQKFIIDATGDAGRWS